MSFPSLESYPTTSGRVSHLRFGRRRPSLSALNPPWYEPRPHAAANTEKPRQVAAPVSYQQMIVDIQETFGLHTTDLADLLQVTRQSVHSWKNINGSTPGKLSITKLSRLREAVAQWRDASRQMLPDGCFIRFLKGRH